jgi:3D (Asp-Asp-Asp) domain-containing protein
MCDRPPRFTRGTNRALTVAEADVELTRFESLSRANAVRRPSGSTLVALAAMILIGATTGTGAQSRSTGTSTLSMTATAYCIAGETSSGTQAKSGTVAADPQVLPMGTTIRVTGLMSPRPQTFTVADTGPAVKGNEIDVFISDCARAKTFGRRRVQVRVLKLPPP